jgi:hypothetical protein
MAGSTRIGIATPRPLSALRTGKQVFRFAIENTTDASIPQELRGFLACLGRRNHVPSSHPPDLLDAAGASSAGGGPSHSGDRS